MVERHPIQPTATPLSWDALRRMQLAWEADIDAAAGVLSFNGRAGLVTLTSADIQAATDGYLSLSITDLPAADPNEPLVRLHLTAGLTFIDGVANAGVAATASSALRVRKNGSANGTITFTGTSGVVSITDLSYDPGELFEIYPPASVDATLDQVSITLRTT